MPEYELLNCFFRVETELKRIGHKLHFLNRSQPRANVISFFKSFKNSIDDIVFFKDALLYLIQSEYPKNVDHEQAVNYLNAKFKSLSQLYTIHLQTYLEKHINRLTQLSPQEQTDCRNYITEIKGALIGKVSSAHITKMRLFVNYSIPKCLDDLDALVQRLDFHSDQPAATSTNYPDKIIQT